MNFRWHWHSSLSAQVMATAPEASRMTSFNLTNPFLYLDVFMCSRNPGIVLRPLASGGLPKASPSHTYSMPASSRASFNLSRSKWGNWLYGEALTSTTTVTPPFLNSPMYSRILFVDVPIPMVFFEGAVGIPGPVFKPKLNCSLFGARVAGGAGGG